MPALLIENWHAPAISECDLIVDDDIAPFDNHTAIAAIVWRADLRAAC